MRGDPDYDAKMAELYDQKYRAKKRKLRWIQAIAGGLALLAIVIMFTNDYRPMRLAGTPYALAIVTLGLFDPDWFSLNQRYTIFLMVIVPAMGFVRLLFVLAN